MQSVQPTSECYTPNVALPATRDLARCARLTLDVRSARCIKIAMHQGGDMLTFSHRQFVADKLGAAAGELKIAALLAHVGIRRKV